MKRVLCAALLGAAAFAVTPAHASEIPAHVTPVVNEHRVGVYTSYGTQPLAGAWVNRDTGAVCVGFGYGIPVCVDGSAS